MSRYTIPAKNPLHTCVVGYDGPLQTFFAQAYIPSPNDTDDDTQLCWLGCEVQAITSLAVLVRQVDPWADIPGAVLVALSEDVNTARPPTLLQRRMQQMMR